MTTAPVETPAESVERSTLPNVFILDSTEVNLTGSGRM